MRKFNLLKWGFMSLFCVLATIAGAQTTITWPLNDCPAKGSENLDTYSPAVEISPSTGIAASITLGSNLTWYRNQTYGTGTDSEYNSQWADVTFAEVTFVNEQGSEETSADDATNAIKFLITPESGYTFTPTKVSLDAMDDGTNNPKIYIKWVNSDASSKELQTETAPNRPHSSADDSQSDKYSEFSYEITDGTASDSECGLYINVYNSYNTKAVGFANVVISGTVKDSEGNVVGDVTYSTALWDWKNKQPSGIENTNIQINTGYVQSTEEDIKMYVDATYYVDDSNHAKFDAADRTDNGDCQINENTIIRIPVLSTSDVVTVTANGIYYSYTIGETTASSTEEIYNVTDNDVAQGYVEIVATGTTYLYSISVEYASDDDFSTINYEKIEAGSTVTFDVTAEPNHSSEDEAIEEFSAITVTIDGTEDVAIVSDKLDDITIYGRGLDVPATMTVSAGDAETSSDKTIYTLTLSQSLTGEGMVSYTLPAGLFTMGNATSNEVSGTVYLKEPEVEGEYEWVFDPEDNTTITGSLDKITITFEYDESEMGIHYYMNPGENDAVKVYKDGTDITETASVDLSYSYDDDNVGYITFGNALEEPGTYTIEIDGPDGDDGAAFNVSDIEGNYEIDLAATTLTYTIVSSAIECELLTKAIATDEDENYYITLSFDSAAKINETNTSIYVDDNAIPYEASNTDNTEYAEIWTLTISKDNLSSYIGSNLSLTVVAETEGGAEGTFTFTVSTSDPDTWTFDPAEYTTFGTSDSNGMQKITISCIDGIKRGESTESITISGIDSDGNEINLGGISIYCNDVPDNNSDPATSCTIELSSALNSSEYWGTYTITIPEDYFWVGDNLESNDETKLIYYVGETTGINGLMLQAGSDDKFYNLNGQRVIKPTQGVYILNGKKILIK